MPVPTLITELSTTASSNSPAGSESPTFIDNYLRTHAAFIAQLRDNKISWGGTAGGTANAFTLTPSTASTSYVTGQAYQFLAVDTNTGAATVNVSGLGAKAVQYDGAALTGSEILSGKMYSIRYDGTQFQLERTSMLRDRKGSDIASAATTDLGTATGNSVDVTHSTGTTAITSLGGASLQAGTEIETRFVISGGTLSLTHHATNLYLAGGANITLANGDVIRWRKMHSSNAEWKMVGGWRADGSSWAVPPSQAEAEAGTATTPRPWTAERVKQAIAALAASSSITLGTPVASTSGTSIDFTSIPSGTKRITINFAGVSGNGTSNMLVQLGDSGGIENTGYISGATNDNGTRVTSTAGFVIISATTAGSSFSGRVTLELMDVSNFTWVSAGQMCETGSGLDGESGGSKSLSAELDRVRITTVGGTDTFDAGKINITYES